MKTYRILSFVEIRNGATIHRFDAVRTNNQYTGDYTCPTLPGDVRVESDFTCLPNSYINSIQDPVRHVAFTRGMQSSIGIIRQIKLRRSRAVLQGTQEDFVELSQVNLYVAPQPIPVQQTTKTEEMPVKKITSAVAPSRSQAAQANSFTELENTILKAIPEIRLAKTLKKSLPTNLKDFLIKFFKEYNSDRQTIYTADKRVQTDVGKRRSLGDIFRICKYYFPDCSLQDVAKLLFVDLRTTITDGFRCSYCHTIHKRVWYYDPNRRNLLEDDTTDEYGHRVPYYTSKLK